MTGVEYQEACASHFGDYKVEECIDYSQYKYVNGICSGYRYTDCEVFHEPIGILKDIPTEYACQSACYHDEFPCEQYKYEAETKTCSFYDGNAEMYCSQIMGPPDENYNYSSQCLEMMNE